MAARRVRRPPSSEGPIARARHGSRPASKRPGDGIRFAPAEADRVLRQALREDRSGADRTTQALLPRGVRAVAFVLAERSGVVSGIRASARLGRLTGLSVRSSLADGALVRPGDRVLELRGEARTILAVERPLLNLLMHLSGVATVTRRAVRAADGAFEVFGTRKTVPGLRGLEKEALLHGGGSPHRRDLASGILVKNNHLRFVPIRPSVERLRRAYGRRWPIEVEVRSARQALEAVDAGADAILVDNASPARARSIGRAARARARPRRLWVELSGGLTVGGLRRYRGSGADAVSLGELTHSAPALPFHLRFAPLPGPRRSPRRDAVRRR